MNVKLYKINDLKDQINIVRKKKLIIVFTNGCFDLLHEGHIRLLSNSKKLCDYLIVGLNSDGSVQTLKGKNRPIDKENMRVKKLSARPEVDAVILFYEETPLRLISELLPDILIKGSDYKEKKVVGSDIVIDNGGKIEFIDLLKGYSTSRIIEEANQ